jgi:DNA-directed RNA polymerase I subunit RPA1
MDHMGIRRPDVFAYDRAMHRDSFASSLSSRNAVRSASRSDSEMEVDDVMSEEETETDEGPGEDTSELPIVARAVNGKVKTSRGRNERLVAPEEVRAHLRWLFRNEYIICSLIFGRRGPYARAKNTSPAKADIFFLDVLVVSPTRFRPPAQMDDKIFEHPHNENLTRVLHTSYTLKDLTSELATASSKGAGDNIDERDRILGKLLENLIVLQTQVNSFIDSSKNPVTPRQGKLPTPGIKQGLEKKEGLFRMHMMVRSFTSITPLLTLPRENASTMLLVQ